MLTSCGELISKNAPKSAPLLQAKKGRFKVNPLVEKLYPTLANFSKLAFLMRKKDHTVSSIVRKYKKEGWDFYPITGRTGYNNSAPDVPGFVTHNKKGKVIVVTFRGSDSSVKDPKAKERDLVEAYDWQVNFDFKPVKVPFRINKKKKPITLFLHRGFSNKAKASHPSLINIIVRLFKKYGPQKVIFTGHSQGAALAPLASFFVTVELMKSGMLGAKFNNAKSNLIQSWVFSAPRWIMDKKTLKIIHKVMGRHNMVRQNVVGIGSDIVPNLSPNQISNSLIKLVPGIGHILAKKYGSGSHKGAGGVGAGYLAADYGLDVATRMAGTEGQGLFDQSLKGIVDTLNDVTGKPVKIIQNSKNAVERATNAMKRAAFGAIAFTHYGGTSHKSSTENNGAYTDSKAMLGAPKPSVLLRQGYEYELKTKKGIAGALRRGLTRVADAKISSDNKIRKSAQKVQSNIKGSFNKLKENALKRHQAAKEWARKKPAAAR